MVVVKNFRSPIVNEKYIKSLKFNKDKSSLDFFIKPSGQFKYKYFSLDRNDKYGYRLVLDIYLIKDDVKKVKKVKKNVIVIAIDAGHGGKDPGAVGKHGTLEKDIVLSISKKLYALLRKEKNIRPVLIRKNDTYISLRGRIKKARKFKADLFISIHADAARNRKASGSSIYVLSQHGASSEAAKWLADKENAADLIGGVSLDDKDNTLAQVILDLSLSATVETSIKASSVILSKLKKVSKIHSHNIGQAGFVVLKSPDIPSMLIETSFLSNPREEKKLKTAKFQKEIARAIRDGILDLIKQGVI
jgi:N-acetylmuramoyl-L-alanine amidase